MRLSKTRRNQVLAFVFLIVLGLTANWTYEYEFDTQSNSENQSLFDSVPAEVGDVVYWAAGYPIKFYYLNVYEGLPPLSVFSLPRFFLNLLIWLGFIAFFGFYESHLKQLFSRKTRESTGSKSQLSLFDLFTITAIVAGLLIYWQWQERIVAAEGKLANEIIAQKGTVSRGVFLPRRLQQLPDFVRFRFNRLVEVKLVNPPQDLVEKSLSLPFLISFQTLGGNYDLRKLESLKEKPFLRSLCIGGRRVDPELIGLVSTLHQVQLLNLMRTNVTAQAIQALGDMPRLRQINFMHTDVKLAELGKPGFAKTLKFLRTGHPEPGVADHFRLDNWPELLQLACDEFEVMESDTPVTLEITNMPKLRHILLDPLAVYDLTLDDLPELQQIDPSEFQRSRRYAPDGDGSVNLRLRNLVLGKLPQLTRLEFYSPKLNEVRFTAPCEASFYGYSNQWADSPNLRVAIKRIPVSRLQQWVEAIASENGPRRVALPFVDFRQVDLSKLSKSSRLQSLNLTGTLIEDRHALQLRGAPELQELRIKWCNVSGNAIASLASSLPRLQKLACEARTVGRIKLENHPQLTSLFAERTIPVQPIDALKLVGMSSLVDAFELPRELFYLHIEDAPALSGLTTCAPWPQKAVLKGVRDLFFFTAGGPNVDDAVVESLLQCKQLQSLTLAYTNASPAMLAKLGQLSKLQYLALSGSQVDDDVVAALASLTNLRTLHLDSTKITDRALDTIVQFKGLTKLTIGETGITDQGLNKLAESKQLEFLGCRGLSLGEQATRAFASLDGLRHLDLSDCQLKPDLLGALGALKALRSVELSGTEINSRALMMLAQQLPESKFGLTDAIVDQQAVLELGSVDRLLSEFEPGGPSSWASQVAQERAVLLAGGRLFNEVPLSGRDEIDPEMFSPDYKPPTMSSITDIDMSVDAVSIGEGEKTQLQPALTQRRALQVDGVGAESMPAQSLPDAPVATMSIPEAVGYALGQVLSAWASSQSSTHSNQ